MSKKHRFAMKSRARLCRTSSPLRRGARLLENHDAQSTSPKCRWRHFITTASYVCACTVSLDAFWEWMGVGMPARRMRTCVCVRARMRFACVRACVRVSPGGIQFDKNTPAFVSSIQSFPLQLFMAFFLIPSLLRAKHCGARAEMSVATAPTFMYQMGFTRARVLAITCRDIAMRSLLVRVTLTARQRAARAV